MGVPAKQVGWMSRFGEQLNLPLSGDGLASCPRTGEIYQLKDSMLTLDEI